MGHQPGGQAPTLKYSYILPLYFSAFWYSALWPSICEAIHLSSWLYKTLPLLFVVYSYKIKTLSKWMLILNLWFHHFNIKNEFSIDNTQSWSKLKINYIPKTDHNAHEPFKEMRVNLKWSIIISLLLYSNSKVHFVYLAANRFQYAE